MKISKIATLFTATALLVGCVNEELRIENTNNKNAEYGYLSLADSSVECVIDRKEVDAGVTKSATRADVNVDTFDCYILDATGEQVIKEFKYGARPTDKIELEKGNYIFKMLSDEIPGAAWESPVYGLTEPFSIMRNTTTSLTNLVCKLLNIQVSVSYSADLKAALSDDTTTTITVADNSLVFVLNETRSGFFLAPNATNDIEVFVKGSYTAEGKTTPSQFEMTATIKGVKGGQYSDINLYLEYSDEGSIAINAEIDGWVIDDEITYDFSTLLAENTIVDDENLPTIGWRGMDGIDKITLSEDKFDSDGNCTEAVYADITAPETIASLVVDITSTNADFITSLNDYGIPTSINFCNVSSTTAMAFKLMGLPVNGDVAGKESVSFYLTPQMKQIAEFGGTHSFKTTVTDAKGGVTEKTLSIEVPSNEVGPKIVWVGYDINQRHTMTDDMTVDIVITAESGIKAFVVQINSDTLTPSELAGVGLCDNLDLVNPENSVDSTGKLTDKSGIAGVLQGFGFPTGDQVLNQQKVEFSITQFLSLLAFTGAGQHNFVLTVTDNDDITTVRTLMLENK